MSRVCTSFAIIPFALFGLLACAEDVPDDPSLSEDSAELAYGAPRAGVAFTMNNATGGNSVLTFRRSPDGELTPAGEFATGGAGTGGGLGNQGALALSDDGRVLLVVNAASNDVSSFAVSGTSLSLRSRVSSGGERPVSVAVRGGLVYVLNAGGINNVSGLYLDWYGRLHPLEGSTRPLSAAAVGPAQVAFSPSGAALVVTEKGTNIIDTFEVRYSGRLRPGVAVGSAGQTPFGFAFTSRGALVVSEAFGGAPGEGAVSSYRLVRDAVPSSWNLTAQLITGPIADLQSAPCWIVITGDDRFAYTSNTASDSISGYRVRADGALTLFDDGGATATTGAGGRPIDMAIDRSSRYLYALNSGTDDIVRLDIAPDGSLLQTGEVVEVPDGSNGLLVR